MLIRCEIYAWHTTRMRFVVSLTILAVLLLLIPDGDAWGRGRRRRRSSRRRRRFLRKVGRVIRKGYNFYKKYKGPIHTAGRLIGGFLGKDAETHIQEIANLKAQDREAYDEYMQLLQDDLEMRYPEEDVSDVIASMHELADMQPDERAAVIRSSQSEQSDDDDEQKLVEDLSDEISE